MFHLALCYFKRHNKFICEAYSGFAFGKAKHSYRIYDNANSTPLDAGYDIEWSMKRIFICSDAGFKWENFATGLALYVNYFMFDPKYSAYNNPYYYVFTGVTDAYNQNLNMLNFERGIFIRGGFEHVQLNLELTLSTQERDKWFINNNHAFVVGVIFNINKRKEE